MNHFNKLFVSSGCPFCREIIPIVRRLNRKLRFLGQSERMIEIINIRDTKDFNTVIFPVIKTISKGEDFSKFDVPFLILGKISGGKIISDVFISGSEVIPEATYEPLLEGYLGIGGNDE